jgi:hypothetical protein
MRLNYVHADYVKQQRLNTEQPTSGSKKQLIPNGVWVTQEVVLIPTNMVVMTGCRYEFALLLG